MKDVIRELKNERAYHARQLKLTDQMLERLEKQRLKDVAKGIKIKKRQNSKKARKPKVKATREPEPKQLELPVPGGGPLAIGGTTKRTRLTKPTPTPPDGVE